MEKIPLAIAHYSAHDPRATAGGVERFARNLALLFEEVRFLTPRDGPAGRAAALRDGLPVVCDNQLVLHWPAGAPLVGFQHGVAAVKLRATRSLGHWRMARAQRRAARRPRTLWVACARWVGEACGRLYGNPARHVIAYPVDVARFDGRLDNAGSRLVLHDARTRHKGRSLLPLLCDAFPAWRFEPLACAPGEVPQRMRRARAFLHLSRYEGNSNVCLEAMAMDLPCLFTRVGVLLEPDAPGGVERIEVEEAFGDPRALVARVDRFLAALDAPREPTRPWVLARATPAVARARWVEVMRELRELGREEAGEEPTPPPAPRGA